MKKLKSELEIKFKEINKAQSILDKAISKMIHFAITNEVPVGIVKLAEKVYKTNQKLKLSIDEMIKIANNMQVDELRQALVSTFLNNGEADDFTKFECLMMLKEHFSIE